MTTLTHAQISDAKNNDLDAVSSVIRETEELVKARAFRFATTAGHTDTDLVEDLAQVGRIAVWESLGEFDGDDPAQFMAHIDRSITRAMADTRRETTRPGVSIYTAKRFEMALCEAAGDPYEAEKIAASEEKGTDRLTPDLARAARLSWLGLDSLDRPYGRGDFGSNYTLGDAIAQEMGVPADLVNSADIASHRRRVIREQVHRSLGLLSERQRHVLKADHGIAPVEHYGDQPDAVLADDMGVTAEQVKQARKYGKKRFEELYRAGARAW
ncbi:sigma factor [Streptomyces sp. NPDC057499]|uniref:sigma factor n=1 Tax=Streptomyces sp. NPDC057499 TaxID=3346150 RepID=UPI003695164B